MTLQSPSLHKLQALALPLGMVTVCSSVALVATYVALTQPLIGAGIAYVFMFLVLAWYRPDIALMLCFAIAPLQNDLSGGDVESHGQFSVSEVNILLTCVVFAGKCLQARRWPSLGPLAIPMFLHFAVCIFSSIQNLRTNTYVSMIQMAMYMIITLMLFKSMGKVGEDFRLAFHGLVVGGVILAIAGLMSSSTYILGLHKNGVGASIASALIIAIELWSRGKNKRYRWIMGMAVFLMIGGLLHTLSRGGWLSALVGIVTISIVRRDYRMLLRFLLILGPLIAICWVALPDKSKEYATGFNSDRENIRARYKSMHYALDKFAQNPVYGLGVGLRKEYDATNIVFATLAETGVVGMMTFILIHVVFFVVMYQTQKQLRPIDPVYSLPALGCALLFGKLVNGMVDHYWSRGALTMAWAAAGMGLSAYVWTLRQKKMKRRGAVL